MFQDNVFIERKADALSNAAFDLAGGEQWVDHPPALDNRGEVCGPCPVLDEIDFDLRHIATPGVSGVSLAAERFVIPMDFGWRFVSNVDFEFAVLREVLSCSGSEVDGIHEPLPQFQGRTLDQFAGDHRRA